MESSGNWRIKRDPSEPKPLVIFPKSFQRRASGSSRGSYSQAGGYRGYQGRQSSSIPPREGFRKFSSDPQFEQSASNGRRLYFGNMPYEANRANVESFFRERARGITGIHMKVNPDSGSSSSFCFVDFESKEMADDARARFNGLNFLGRAANINWAGSGHSVARTTDSPALSMSQKMAFEFGHPSRSGNAAERYKDDGRRLFIGGLPRFYSQEECNIEIRKLFEGFTVTVISELFPPHQRKNKLIGNHHYCFIDLATVEECNLAVEELDEIDRWNWAIKVRKSLGTSANLNEIMSITQEENASGRSINKKRLFVSNLPEFPDQETTELRIRELFEGFEVLAVSKLHYPKEPLFNRGSKNDCYCFVELATEEQANRAKLDLAWKTIWGGEVRVKTALSNGPMPSTRAYQVRGPS